MKKLFIIALMMTSVCCLGQNLDKSPILFIYDASGSMWAQIEGQTKKDIANDVLADVLSSLPKDQNVGLIAYGHRQKGDCTDIEYLVEYNTVERGQIITTIKDITPLGKTPLADATVQAIDVIVKNQTKATIILITDGIESCGGDICQVVETAKQKGIEFKMHIVGFGLKENEAEELKCAAKAGEGQYYDAQDAQGLGEVLNVVTTKTVDTPQENVSFYTVKNGIPLDAWIRIWKDNQEKPIDVTRTYQDTGFLYLPAGSYTAKVQPLEGSDLKARSIAINVPSSGSYHKDVFFDAGIVQVLATDNNQNWDALVKLINPDTDKVAASTRTYKTQKELSVDPGTYKVTFAPMGIEGPQKARLAGTITVNPGETVLSSYNFDSGFIRVGVRTEGGELIDAILKFKHLASGKVVESKRSYTNPQSNPKTVHLDTGEYSVSVKALGKHKSLGSKEFKASVKTGETYEKLIVW